ncbi:hypothetical protein HELRODRAFT_164373 [Helobdella robusta]|uniref:Uncharacterized protein n=1 Tax=Helobdella robusta TaxID=6412 RepID=T1EVC1_HELRO|nr:hypothetical protein HELRODRAFT_164373 [Helobdella robusta]ESN94517.1 hypothetical protein HELRODRAFT_164373 [Helobdella robusta]
MADFEKFLSLMRTLVYGSSSILINETAVLFAVNEVPSFKNSKNVFVVIRDKTNGKIWVLRSTLNFVSDEEVVRERGLYFQRKGPKKASADLARVATAREQDMEIYKKRKGHEQLDEQQS